MKASFRRQHLTERPVSHPIRVDGIGAVEFKEDDRSSLNSQDGYQLGTGGQSFSFGASYKVIKKTRLSARVSTGGGLYTSNNKHYRFPLFDTASNLHNRTSYTLSLSRSL